MGGLDWVYWMQVIFQLLVALLCGGLIGYQRETTERPAGFRTHILVCVGSAVYMLVSVAVAGAQYDPGRIAAQVASGIGFLGAGTIIKQGSVVRGLTTAASLWAVAGIGLAAGYGGRALSIAVLGTGVVFLALSLLRQFELRFERGHRIFVLEITLQQPRERVEWLQQILAAHNVEVQSLAIGDEHEGQGSITIEGRIPLPDAADRVVRELMRGRGVLAVRNQVR